MYFNWFQDIEKRNYLELFKIKDSNALKNEIQKMAHQIIDTKNTIK